MALTGSDVVNDTVALYAANSVADQATIKTATNAKPTFRWDQSVAIAANAAIEVPIGVAGLDLNVTTAIFYPGATSAADATNFASLQLEQSTPAGVITAIGTAITTATVPLTKNIARALTVTPANAFVPAGNQIVFKVSQAASGVAVGPGVLVVTGEYV